MRYPNSDIHSKLIEQCARGNTRAQHRLYAAYSKAMYNIALRLLANKMDAEDALQEAFVQAFKNIEDYRGEAAFGAWLRKIVINYCLNFLQRNKTIFESLEEQNESVEQQETEKQEDAYGFQPEQIQQAILKLPEGSRIVLNLYLLEGYKHREIAAMLHISESTSKSQYQRAKKLLKQTLTK